jgi:hypothetical protein
MLVAAARVEEVLPSISKSSCSEDKGGGGGSNLLGKINESDLDTRSISYLLH